MQKEIDDIRKEESDLHPFLFFSIIKCIDSM